MPAYILVQYCLLVHVSDNEECPIQRFHLLCVHMTMDDVPEETGYVRMQPKCLTSLCYMYI